MVGPEVERWLGKFIKYQFGYRLLAQESSFNKNSCNFQSQMNFAMDQVTVSSQLPKSKSMEATRPGLFLMLYCYLFKTVWVCIDTSVSLPINISE